MNNADLHAHTASVLNSQAGGTDGLASSEGRPSAGRVIELLRQAVRSGRPWHFALLEAIGNWPLAYEDVDGARYRYILLGEAFDWITLASRLLEEVRELVPQEAMLNLLFYSKLPGDVQDADFKSLVGPEKHSGYLNYFYGVTVEEALVLATEEEIRKERNARGLQENSDITDMAYQRIYGQPQRVLVQQFTEAAGRRFTGSLTFMELKEFTYWLFKKRVHSADSSRVASDTKKGMVRLQHMHDLDGEHMG